MLLNGRRISGQASSFAALAQYAMVYWKDARGQWLETHTDALGAFHVIAAPGPVVFAGAPGGSLVRPAGGPEVRIAAEATEVTVNLQ